MLRVRCSAFDTSPVVSLGVEPMSLNDTAVRTAILVVVLLVAVPLLAMLLMMPMMAAGGWGMHPTGHGPAAGWAWFPMLVIPLLILAGLGYLGYRVVIQDADTTPRSPLADLRAAYARGDLTEAQFEQRRDRLLQDDTQRYEDP